MPGPITDHRGRPVTFSVLVDDQLRLVKDSAIPADRREGIERRLHKALHARTSNQRLVGPMIAGAVIIGVLLLGPPYWAAALAIVVMGLVCTAVGAIQIARLHLRHGAAIIGAFLAERCCPTCGYDLNGGQAGDDGCTACSECGAAWRLTETSPAAPAAK